jgi:methylated-DNA-protein-cysteine methyltransferase-like protein
VVDDFAEAVLSVVRRIPRGKVMAYGDIAEFLGAGTPRMVGHVMSLHGTPDVPWQRVVRSSGDPAPSSPAEALRLLRDEGTPLRGDRVDMRRARWDGT